MARQDVAADALVVAEVGTRKEYRAPLWQASVPKRVLIVGPCEFSQIRSRRSERGLLRTSTLTLPPLPTEKSHESQ